jgi:hypothetical protein
VPREALTVGLRTLLAARELLLIVTGAEKAEALHAALEGPMGPASPASLLRGHPCLTVLCDREAGRRLRPTASRDSAHVAIVLGHREPGISAEHRISAHSRAPGWPRAAALCRQTPVRAVLLTGYTHTDGLSEAEQMGREWPLADVPVLLEVAGRNTAENASLVAAHRPRPRRGGARQRRDVAWHLRAPYFFAPYRRFGLELRLCPARPLRGSVHLLAEELGGLAGMARQRRAAMDAIRLPEGRRVSAPARARGRPPARHPAAPTPRSPASRARRGARAACS